MIGVARTMGFDVSSSPIGPALSPTPFPNGKRLFAAEGKV